MSISKENRDNSFKKLDLKGRQLEILNLVKENGPITPQQAIDRGLQGDRRLNEVHPRFNELWKKGYLIITGSFYNQRSENKNSIYRISTDDEARDYTKKAGQAWTNRIKELESDFHSAILSDDTQKWIKKQINDLKTDIKNLRYI